MKVDFHFKVLLNISLLAIINDLLGYFFKIQYSISLVISTIILIIINLFLNKKIKSTHSFELLDICFFAILIANVVLKISIPDSFYDTHSYHLYLQENVNFIDKINFDFFPTHVVNGFTFALGDRMFYIFRFILGFRLGTLLSYYLIIVLFYQVKKVLKLICGDSKIIPLVSLAICYSSSIINTLTGSYYIDTLQVVFILEIIILLIENKDIFNNPFKLLIMSLLVGICTAIKLSNLILIIFIIAYFLIKGKSKIGHKMLLYYFLGLILFFLPFAVYIFDNIKQTGNPIFPGYNNIFKSIYYSKTNFIDSRLGIPKFLIPIWPIYTSIFYEWYGDGWHVKDYIWGIGYIIIIVFVFQTFINKKIKSNEILNSIGIISLVLTFVWIFLLSGYMRYALIIPILYAIVIGSQAVYFYNRVIKNKLEKIIHAFEHYLFLQFFPGILIIVLSINMKIIDNYSLILKDRNVNKIYVQGVFGSTDDNVGYTALLRGENIPIYNIKQSEFDGSYYALDKYEKVLRDKDIYVFVPYKYRVWYEYIFENNNFKYVKVNEYDSKQIPILEKNSYLYLYKLNKLD